MGHAWNVIKVNGNWYHVDLTWDDPEPNRIGNVGHKNFLLSDEGIRAEGHTAWNYPRNSEAVQTECVDKQYDNLWWRDVSTEIFRINGEWFSVDESGEFTSRDVNTGKIIENTSISFTVERDRWYAWNSSTVYWLGNYTTFVRSGNVFFYNTTEDVYVINIDGSNKRHVARFAKADNNGFQIYGMGIDENDMLYVILQNNPQIGRAHV